LLKEFHEKVFLPSFYFGRLHKTVTILMQCADRWKNSGLVSSSMKRTGSLLQSQNKYYDSVNLARTPEQNNRTSPLHEQHEGKKKENSKMWGQDRAGNFIPGDRYCRRYKKKKIQKKIT